MDAVLEIPEFRKRAKLLTIKEYHTLGELGFLPKKTELIEGVVIQKMPKSPRHTFLVKKLHQIFSKVLPAHFHVASEQPITLKHSEPEPDISIIFGGIEDYVDSHPKQAELVLEVSLSTLSEDRAMASIYASSNIPEYWLFNLSNNTVEVYSKFENGRYNEKKIFTEKDVLSPIFAPDIEIKLLDLLKKS